MKRVDILYFSDILCVWAYVCERRLDELEATFGAAVALAPHFVSVFGDAHGKLKRGWSERGGAAGYAAHVHSVCHRMGHTNAHSDCWKQPTPRSSVACHLYLSAIRAVEDDGMVAATSTQKAARAMRLAFFEEARDVSQHAEQRRIAESLSLPVDEIESRVESGAAHARLTRDYDLVREHDVKMSPTLIFNEGRQRLNGNVGYRVIEANVRELLNNEPGTFTWC